MWDHFDPRSTDSRSRPSPGRGGSTSTDSRSRSGRDPRDAFTDGLDLPRGRARDAVSLGDETFKLRGSEVRARDDRCLPAACGRHSRRPWPLWRRLARDMNACGRTA